MSDVYYIGIHRRWTYTYPGNTKRSAQSLFFRGGYIKRGIGQSAGHIIRAPWRILIIGSAKKEPSDFVRHEGSHRSFRRSGLRLRSPVTGLRQVGTRSSDRPGRPGSGHRGSSVGQGRTRGRSRQREDQSRPGSRQIGRRARLHRAGDERGRDRRSPAGGIGRGGDETGARGADRARRARRGDAGSGPRQGGTRGGARQRETRPRGREIGRSRTAVRHPGSRPVARSSLYPLN